MRVGIGFDVHRFTKDRPLVLGGVRISYSQGLMGHSDADVISHAIMDALMGAVSAGDIGEHFPDTDPQYKGVSSLDLLVKVGEMIAAHSCEIANIDVVVVLEKPKLADYRKEMKKRLSRALRIGPDQISIKATTSEGLGFVGRGEGIAAQAVALVEGAGSVSRPGETVGW